jgi:hypothetical protein
MPTELGLLTRTTEIYVDFNLLTGPIPSELGKLNGLERLDLHDNLLSGSVPSELAQVMDSDAGGDGERLCVCRLPLRVRRPRRMAVLSARRAAGATSAGECIGTSGCAVPFRTSFSRTA